MADRKYYCICDAGCKFETLTKEQIYAAITQAVNNGVIGDCDTGFVTTIKTVNGYGLKFFIGTQSEYEVLTNKENVFAIITNDNYKESLFECIQDLDTNFTDFAENVKNGSFVVGEAKRAQTADNADNATNAKNLITNLVKVGATSFAVNLASGLYACILGVDNYNGWQCATSMLYVNEKKDTDFTRRCIGTTTISYHADGTIGFRIWVEYDGEKLTGHNDYTTSQLNTQIYGFIKIG